MATSAGKVLSVNIGAAREFEYGGRPAKNAIWKSPVVGRIAVRGVNLAGDDQADRKAHGGPDKVVYAYAVEDARWWQRQICRSLVWRESHHRRDAGKRRTRRRTLADRHYSP
jgi:MOSC domain-containing protein YiiM